jgi:hypothetical protein
MVARIDFDVLQSWNRCTARTVSVITDAGGGSCGYLAEPGGVYVIFVHRSEKGELYIKQCSNNQPLLCTHEVLRKLGRPAVRHQSLPHLENAGSDDEPITPWTRCASHPQPPSLDAYRLFAFPRGIELRDFSVTILRNGRVRDLQFVLYCRMFRLSAPPGGRLASVKRSKAGHIHPRCCTESRLRCVSNHRHSERTRFDDAVA